MSIELEAASVREAATASCWNRIGVQGDSTCGELERHVHCRNCPVFRAAAAELLNADPPPDYLARWTRQVAQSDTEAHRGSLSALVFRIGAEWLALPARVVDEIASTRSVHSIPQRRDGIVTGLTSIRGELIVCVSLQRIAGIAAAVVDTTKTYEEATARMLVLRHEGKRVVCPVDQIHGIVRYGLHELRAVPPTVGRSAACFARAVLNWQRSAVGLLDDERLFEHINRSLS